MTENADIVRRAFEAFQNREREVFDGLLADDFRFSSPHDPDLDRAGYFERCWPHAGEPRDFQIERIFVQGDEAFVRYLLGRPSGERFRNTEYFRFTGDRIAE